MMSLGLAATLIHNSSLMVLIQPLYSICNASLHQLTKFFSTLGGLTLMTLQGWTTIIVVTPI